jgi:glutamate racemase
VILVFDSGLGGLTVHAEIVKALPAARFIYVADDAAFPYGRLTADVCAARVVDVLGVMLQRYRPDIAVIACNTASTVALPALRSTHTIPFVGTVPAVKPAAAQSRSKIITVLGTPGTVNREYTHDLIIAHAADCRVTLVGAPNLARLAEAYLKGESVSDGDVLEEIAPCFREKDGQYTDAIALACTHYPLLLEVYHRVQPWEVEWIDPSPAIAKRVLSLLDASLIQSVKTLNQSGEDVPQVSDKTILFTSGRRPSKALAGQIAARGFKLAAGGSIPFHRGG